MSFDPDKICEECFRPGWACICASTLETLETDKIVKDLKSPIAKEALKPKCSCGCPGKTIRETFFDMVNKERTRQDKKHGNGGPQRHTLPDWNMILAEEKGERIKEENEIHFRDKPIGDCLKELVHEAAVALAIYEALIEGRVYSDQPLYGGKKAL